MEEIMAIPSERVYVRLPEEFGDLDEEVQLDWLTAILEKISPNPAVRAEAEQNLRTLAQDPGREA
jgi:hypothetical protein